MTNETTNQTPEVVMYTQALCGFCAAARALLDNKGVAYREIDVTLNDKLRREMVERSGLQAVPQIFIDGEHIGGFDEISVLDKEGKLNDLLGLTGYNMSPEKENL